MRRLPIPFVAGIVIACVVLIGVSVRAQGGNAAARTLKNPVAPAPASVTAGAAAYKKYCAFCHGAAGKGDGRLAPRDSMPADLTDDVWDHGATDGEIFTVIATGIPNTSMVGFKGKMPDQDLWHVVNFLRSIGPTPPAR